MQIIFFGDERAIAVKKYGSVHYADKLWADCGKNGIEFFHRQAQDAPSFRSKTHIQNI
jgi:hypothetical protein